ncbi:hypothetical protein I8H84_02675 [Candidatus Saccharibacteria bacterium]|nr:hypothetical protein [Candidatus Saccharibacteria bacterium]MBH1972848.1 hypothetical protein [Candidatus Saccharibacteria bacterium]MBH1991049.1 hypothetical protein [Candidatus Saccharibacteria bacterium]
MVTENGIDFDLKNEKFGTDGLSMFYRLKDNKKDPSKADESLMVTSLGENWNTFWEQLERFDEGFKDLLPEEDC